MNHPTFQMLDGRNAEETQRWLSLWEAWSDREVFAHPEYVRLFATETSHPMCATATQGGATVLYPLLLREIDASALGLSEAAYDLTAPYGYGGPFCTSGCDKEELAAAFWPEFERWAKESQVVSEFIRFSLFDEALLPYPGEKEKRLENVVCDLALDPERLWMGFEHKVRKNVNKAKRSGVEIALDSTGERLDDFLRIYEHTLTRREARSDYYFGREFFERINSNLAGHYLYLHAEYEGKIVSTELILLSKNSIYSFLGGTDEAYYQIRPNDLLKHEAILWAKQQGKTHFVLGGGYQPDDGIYKYKLGYAPQGITPFYVGRRIYNQPLYDELVERNRRQRVQETPQAELMSGFFPAYRA